MAVQAVIQKEEGRFFLPAHSIDLGERAVVYGRHVIALKGVFDHDFPVRLNVLLEFIEHGVHTFTGAFQKIILAAQIVPQAGTLRGKPYKNELAHGFAGKLGQLEFLGLGNHLGKCLFGRYSHRDTLPVVNPAMVRAAHGALVQSGLAQPGMAMGAHIQKSMWLALGIALQQ